MTKFLLILATVLLAQWAACRMVRWVVLRPVDRRRPAVQDDIRAMLRRDERYSRGSRRWRVAIGARWAELCVRDMGDASATTYLRNTLRAGTLPHDDFDHGVQVFLDRVAASRPRR
ncbi:hypothetical protein CE139_13215 [Pseudomonas oryzihabitans]|uniref:Uncharacterized protein n=1 Tax=Pseudomonas oryzihabitans TaxID=47885 RepID=A0A2Z5A814_9PSED|nr:hypothetical protein CE139_13215 [Pseudomonas oryzihabitans]